MQYIVYIFFFVIALLIHSPTLVSRENSKVRT